MRRIILAAALLVGAAVPPALSAQQHVHGDAARDTAHADSAHHPPKPADAHRMHTDSAHRAMTADSARARSTSPANGDHHHPPSAPPPPPAVAPGPHEGHHAEPAEAHAHPAEVHAHAAGAPGGHRMAMQPLGDGWTLMGMAQAFPIVTAGLGDESSALRETEPYLTQPALMINLESPGSAFVLRSTLNFEGVTQPGGELTPGGWGEGFIDRRHPHTLLHELMVSANLWNAAGGALSLSIGKGFAPYGTDDPMSRPVAKYPTNHHLSQILERWTANVVYLRGPWSVEAGLFGGAEPEGPYDLSNYEAFGDSWSARVIRRFGGTGTAARWEVAGSYGSVAEEHHDGKERTALVNGYLRHAAAHRFGTLYSLVEASRSEPEGEAQGYYALLGETMAGIGRHRPYLRVEYSTRPEWEREEDSAFRYHHDDEPVGATRWLIASAGYGWQLSGFPFSTMPFVEAQHNRVWNERGEADTRALFGGDRFWSVSAGVRLFLGSAGPMRMGSYGVLDDMTSNHRPAPGKGMGHGGR